MTGVSNERRDISCLMLHAKHVEEVRAKKKSSDGKREIFFHEGSSKNRLEIQDNPRFKKRVTNQVHPSYIRLVVIGCLTLSLRR